MRFSYSEKRGVCSRGCCCEVRHGKGKCVHGRDDDGVREKDILAKRAILVAKMRWNEGVSESV